MGRGAITEQMDVASLVFTLFMLSFVLLIAYLHRESKREGYPLVDSAHEPTSRGLFGMPGPKTYHLSDGTSMSAPHHRDDARPIIPAAQMHQNAGFPIVPYSTPMYLGIGPGAYANRRDIPDVTYDGKNRIVPMKSASHFSIAPGDEDLRGMMVLGADGASAGKVVDLWVDQSETTIRYLEVALAGPHATDGHVLVPMPMADIDATAGTLTVDAILAERFADVPRTKSATAVTLLEEERIMAYFGGGYLYATPERQEPLV